MQGEIERKYASSLHAVVKHMAEPLAPLLEASLVVEDAEQLPAREAAASCEPLKAALDEVFLSLAASLDVRVLRRLMREVWNVLAGVRT